MNGFNALIEPMAKNLSSRGVPEDAIKEVKEAMSEWFQKEVSYETIAPKLAELYMQEFSEEELGQITAFYDTPIGQKMLSKLPVLMQKSAMLSQEQLQGKQADLQKRIMEILSKHQPPPPVPGSSPTPPPAPGAK